MKLSDLTSYAEKKYQIAEEHNWDELPGISVLADKDTGKWIAYLMREWDSDLGKEIERCDIRADHRTRIEYAIIPFVSSSYRMFGKKWVGIDMDSVTDDSIVYQIFDRAVESCKPKNYTYILESFSNKIKNESAQKYKETPLSFGDMGNRSVPEQIRKMRSLNVNEYGNGTFYQKCKNFYVQGKFMENYEDNAPWDGQFHCYFPTYNDLSNAELRGYFTWRTNVRKGVFKHTSLSMAYIYIYELINGIGVSSPMDALEKLHNFKVGYVDSYCDFGLENNINQWEVDLCVVHGIDPVIARQYLDSEWLCQDKAWAVLRAPQNYELLKIYDALLYFGEKKLKSSLVVEKFGDEGKCLFAEAWKYALANYRYAHKSLFAACFGGRKTIRCYPFGNAIYWEQQKPKPGVYELDECRKYTYSDGEWKVQCYSTANFAKKKFWGFIHEAERMFRLYLKAGHPLKENPAEIWATPFIQDVINADREAKLEASRPKVTIRFSELEQIRQDAVTTRDSLLTEEDMDEVTEPSSPVNDAVTEKNNRVTEDNATDNKQINLPLNAEQIKIISMLLHDQSVKTLIASQHGMATVIADGINEALFDLLGDNSVECDGEDICLVEDYREDIQELLGEING